MSKRKRAGRFPGGYVMVPKRITSAPAWRAMSPWARLVWLDARGWLRNKDWANNGTTLHRSCRKAAEAIGCSTNTAMVAFAENEYFGFMRRTAQGFLGSDGHGIAAHYRFTDLPYGGTHPATMDFEKWDGSPFLFRGRRRGPRKQNPVANLETPRRQRRDIRKDRKRVPYVANGETYTEAQGVANGETYLDVHPPVQPRRGSSTDRAPTQVGEAGSSPAPVSTLTEYVLSIVNAELDRLK